MCKLTCSNLHAIEVMAQPEVQCIYKGGDSHLRDAEKTKTALQKSIEGLSVLERFSTKNSRYHAKVQPIYDWAVNKSDSSPRDS